MSIKRFVPQPRSWWQNAIDAIVPPIEPMCDPAASDADWQPDLANPDVHYCYRCGISTGFGEATETGCANCRNERKLWDMVWRLGAYTEPLSDWVVSYKFGGAWGWGPWFGQRLAEITPTLDESSIVVPVPLHWYRRLSRGYDQAAILAESFAQAKGVLYAPILRRIKFTRPQTHAKSKSQRLKNIGNVFEMAPVDLSGYTVWLVDDVLTTGATLERCIKALRPGKPARINVAVIAVRDFR